ncbi:MAG TPA: PRTRC system protein B, partial [Pedobacter sp.]
LTVRESTALAKALDTSEELKSNFLKPAGILPKNVLYINPDRNGYAVWHTPEQYLNLLFSKDLTIPNGKTFIPSLIWKASKKTLQIYAYESGAELNEQTLLYHAPFFNIYNNGKVCMGTVAVNIQPDCLLEEFIQLWQQYFFNSYFSHLMQEHNPVKGNIIQLWSNLVGSRKKFPHKALRKNGLTLKNLIQ